MKKYRILSAFLAVLMFCGALSVLPAGAIPAIYEGVDTNPETGTIDYATTIEEFLVLETDEAPIGSAKAKLDTMKLMWENDFYRIYADDITGEVAVVKKSTDEILFTNPWDITTSKTNSMDEKKKLLSQIILNYTDNGTSKTMNSTVDAAMRGQIKIKHIKNGIRVEYAIGRQNSRFLVPRMISKTAFESKVLIPMREAVNNEVSILITPKATYKENEQPITKYPNAAASGKIQVGQSYKYYDLIKFENPNFDMNGTVDYTYDHQNVKELLVYYQLYDPTAPGVTDKQISDMNKDYPITKKMAVYVFDEAAKNTELIKAERLIKTWVTAYSFEQLDADHLETEYEGTTKAPALFKIALEYTIDAQGLTVRLPANGIRFDESLYQLDSITVLPFMGAGKSANGGYNFFPDGAGALFDYTKLNNGTNTTLSAQIYGSDFAYHKITGKHQETVRYPVFGSVENWKGGKTVIDYDNLISPAQKDADGNIIKEAVYGTKVVQTEEDRGFVAIIEEGDSMAQIATSHLNASSEYSSMQMTFFPRPSDTYNMSDAISVGKNTDIKVVSSRKYVGNYKIKYIMLTDDELAAQNSVSNYYKCSWVGMAEAYRDYLEYTGVFERLTEEETNDNIPLYIETFGTVETVEKILSMPVNVMTPLTTFDNIKTMYSELSKAIEDKMGALAQSGNAVATNGENSKNFNNINFKLTGYANGGMYSTVPYHLNWEEVLGGASGFEELVNEARKEGFGVFPDFDFAYINTTALFDGVDLMAHAVKTIDNRYTSRREYDATYQTYVGYFELAISPAFFARFVTKLSINYMKYNPIGISVSTLGTDLNSDFDEEDPYNREDAMQFTINALRQLSLLKNDDGEYMKVMTSGGNAYTLKYVDHIINTPLNSSNYNSAGNTVPFVGMVLHGYKLYAGTPINEEGNLESALLRAIENGSGLYFKLSYQNTDVLKEFTRLSENYSIRYDIWKDDVVDMYVELNNLLADLQTKLIIDHEFLVADRIPDADEAEADQKAKEEAEALKEAEKLAEEAKVALREALELRKTPGKQSDVVAKAFKNAAEQAIKAAKAAAKIDAKYVDDAYATLKAANAANKAADDAYFAIYDTAAYEAGETAAKNKIANLIAETETKLELQTQLGADAKDTIDAVFKRVIENAAIAGGKKAIELAIAEEPIYATSKEQAEAIDEIYKAVLKAAGDAANAEAEAVIAETSAEALEKVQKIVDAVLGDVNTVIGTKAADVINEAKNGYETGKKTALTDVENLVNYSLTKNHNINAAIEAGVNAADIENANVKPYEDAVEAAKKAAADALKAYGGTEDDIAAATELKAKVTAAQEKYDAAKAEYDAALAEVNSSMGTTSEERDILKAKSKALDTAKNALDAAKADYDLLKVTGAYATTLAAAETAAEAENTLALIKAAIESVAAEKAAIEAASDTAKAAALLRLAAIEKTAEFDELAPSLRANLVNLETAYVAAKAEKKIAEEALALAEEATEKLLEKLNATKNDPEATDAEKQRAEQFYGDACLAVEAAKANLALINAKIADIEALIKSDKVLGAKVLVFGDEDIKIDYNDAITNNGTVVGNTNDIIDEVQLVVDLKAQYEKAKADYDEAKAKYEELLTVDLTALAEDEAVKVRAERMATAIIMAQSEDIMTEAKGLIDTYTVVFRNRYENIVAAYAKLESAKEDIDALVNEAFALKGENTDANNTYIEALKNKVKITSLYNEATKYFDDLCELAVTAGLIDENGELVSGTVVNDNKPTEEEEEAESKYTYDDGSVVAVTYGDKEGKNASEYRTFILNYNSFDIMVKYDGEMYEIKAYGYAVINH